MMLFITSIVISQGTEEKENMMRIGLLTGSNAVSLAYISGTNGLNFGYRVSDQDELITLMSFEMQHVIIKQDDYFLRSGNNFYLYNFTDSSDPNDADIKGPIHLELGQSFDQLSEARAYQEVLEEYGIDSYLSLDQSWHLWSGEFNTYSQAESALADIKSKADDVSGTIIGRNPSRVQITDLDGNIMLVYYPTYGNYFFQPIDDEFSFVDYRPYRGEMLIKNAGNGRLTVINFIELESYLYGVLPKEVVYTWPKESLKAQAVAARTYALANMHKHENEGYHLCASTNCQVYGGYGSEKAETNDAVNETKGYVMTYNDKLISAFYHHSSGGYTENSENVWTSVVGYLKGVEDKYLEKKTWERSYTYSSFESLLSSRGYNTGTIQDVYIESYSHFGSVYRLVVVGSNGTFNFEKDGIRKAIGYNTIKSLKFELDFGEQTVIKNDTFEKNSDLTNLYVINQNGEVLPLEVNQAIVDNGNNQRQLVVTHKPETFTIRGTGWGHGLGLSQMGAKAYAENGFTYDEILTHYYTGVKLIIYDGL